MHYTPLLVMLLILISVGLTMQGALRDGVMTWIPTYLSNTFNVGTAVSIFATTLLPIVNLLGVYVANFINKKLKKDEMQTSSILFVVSIIACGLITLLGSHSLLFSLVSFSVVTSCMMGINIMLVSFIPTYFIKWGKVSSISGLLNSTVYIGSSIATFGIGAIADKFGWNILLIVLCMTAAAGACVCFIAMPKWKCFLKQIQTEHAA